MRSAILFTAYAWDGFVQRQYDRLRARAGGIAVHAAVDAIDHLAFASQRVDALPVTRELVEKLLGPNACRVEEGPWGRPATLWWNVDYYLYAFFEAHPEVETCLMLDFDAWSGRDAIPALFDAVAARGLAFVGHPHPDLAAWSWTRPHLAAYPADLLRGAMLPVTVMSRTAARHLRRRRQEMAREHAAGRLPFWPFCEAFVATELDCLGFRTASLAQFGDTSRLRWRPGFAEDEIAADEPAGFVHPVRPAGGLSAHRFK